MAELRLYRAVGVHAASLAYFKGEKEAVGTVFFAANSRIHMVILLPFLHLAADQDAEMRRSKDCFMRTKDELIGNEKLAEAIRVAIDSAREAGNDLLVADLISILRKVPEKKDTLKLHYGLSFRSENCM